MADFEDRRPLAALLASLCLLAAGARAGAASLGPQFADIAEQGRYAPANALERLQQLETQARSAPERADYLFALSDVQRNAGLKSEALATAERLITLAKAERDDAALAKGLLVKGHASYGLDDLRQSHQLWWEADRIAERTGDKALRTRTALMAGQAYADEGNFPPALKRVQSAVALARASGDTVLLIHALQSLAFLYGQLKDFDHGFDILAEAMTLANQHKLAARMAMLKEIEYGLAVETGQHDRGLDALLTSLAYERRSGAEALSAATLVNLSDSYLRRKNYKVALDYGMQAMQAARQFKQMNIEATANVNIGQAYLGMGRMAEGKRSFLAGLAWYEKTGDKPALQQVLMEYGAALERAGDLDGAVRAYHQERALSNELFEVRRQKATLELQERYEAEDRQRQIQLLQRENEVKSAELYSRTLERRVWWLLALVFALVSVIVGVLYRKVRHANAQLQVRNQELKQQSSRDPLTALYNRRHFQEFMRAQAAERVRLQRASDDAVGALFLLDIDHFKQINDSYGHAAGDAVLKVIADSLREILRETDMIVRWGGEEFLAFLPSIPHEGLDEVARRLLNGIAANTVTYQGKDIKVYASIGFAPFPHIPGCPVLGWERAVNLVDMTLYLAKAHGRNRAYGVQAFNNIERISMEAIEQDLEQAWRGGHVELSVVPGGAEPSRTARSA